MIHQRCGLSILNNNTMEKHDVEYFGTLLNEKPEDVEKAITDGTLSEKVKALKLMNEADVTTMKTNFAKEVKVNHINELVEEAKKGNLDKELHKVIKGATLEITEKSLAKEYKVDEYEGINDLVAKAISKNKGQTDDTKLQELNQKFETLQGINKNLVKEKDDAITEANKKADYRVLSRDKKDIVKGIPFDFSDVKQEDLKKITDQRRQIVESVFDAKYNLVFQGDTTVVEDKEGNLVKDPNTLAAIPPSDVMKMIPVELGIKIKSPEAGGQGGSSSGGNGSAQFATIDEFNKYCDDRKIKVTSAEGIKIYAERGKLLI